jgi:hypothetical protein
MGIVYNYGIDPSPYFLWDAQNIGFYNSETLANNLLQGGNMTVSGVSISDAPIGKTYTFENSTNSIYASDKIFFTPLDTSMMLSTTESLSAFVTFNNTSLLSPSAPTYYRQTPFSCGSDGNLGNWNFERFSLNGDYLLRYKFDQEGTYGNTMSFGSVGLGVVTQLGFVLGNGLLKIYKNGAYVGSLNVSSKTLSTLTPRTIGIGAAAGAIYGFIGNIHNTCFWRHALSDSQIEQFYIHTVRRYS